MNEETNKPNFYQFKLKLLGHEIFEIEFGSTLNSNKWIAITSLVTFAVVVIIGAFGHNFVQLYKLVIGG